MPIVTIPTPLRQHTGGLDRVEGTGATVGAVLESVVSTHPELRDRLFDGAEVRRFVNVYVNNEDIRYLEELETPVTDRDEISIIPAIAGGSL